MVVNLKTRDLCKTCNGVRAEVVREDCADCPDAARLVKRYGPRQAQLIRQRLAVLVKAGSLADVGRAGGAQRLHALSGERAGTWSLDLMHPHRLLFRIAHKQPPFRPDGGIDWGRVTEIEIVGIEDTHH